jgi:hypothetical protein
MMQHGPGLAARSLVRYILKWEEKETLLSIVPFGCQSFYEERCGARLSRAEAFPFRPVEYGRGTLTDSDFLTLNSLQAPNPSVIPTESRPLPSLPRISWAPLHANSHQPSHGRTYSD